MKLVRGFVVLLLFTLVFSACQSKYMTSAKVYMQQNNWKNAKEQLLLEVEHNPQNGEAYAYLGEAYEMEGDYLKSGENFTKAKELVTKKKLLQKIKDTQLSLSGKHVTRGTQFHGAEEFGKAVDEYEIATQIFPEYLLARHNLAIALLKADRYEDGKRAWGDVLALSEEGEKEWEEAHSLLSRLAHQDSNYTLAMEHNDALLNGDPENIELLSFKAACLEALGKFEEALAIYEIIIKLDPGNVDAWFNMGVIHDRLGDTAKAEECFRKAAEAAPEDKDAQHNLGIMALKMENWELAKTAFQKVVELDENDAAGWQNLSLALVKLGDTKAAQEAFDKATELQGDESSGE